MLTLIPEGVGSISVISPIGSGSSETTFNPEIIESILASFNSSLSIKADPIDFSLAASKSFLFSSRISLLLDSISKEMSIRASFFISSEACERTFEACFASAPNLSIYKFISLLCNIVEYST